MAPFDFAPRPVYRESVHPLRALALALAALLAPPLVLPVAGSSKHWPAFRGEGDSRSGADNLPATWSDTENLAWRISLPGYAQSSPVIWDERVFTTSTEGPNKETMHAFAIDLRDGSILWEQSVPATLRVPDSDMVSRAAPTPVVDARAVYFFFESGDLVAFNHDGKELWKRSLTAEYGNFMHDHGLGSSPANAPDSLVILVDHEAPGYLLNIDKKTGANLWKLDRPERASWSSPVYSDATGRGEILLSSNGIVESYDLATGKQLWFVEGVEGNTVSAPSATKDLVVVASSTPGMSLRIDRDGSGDVSLKKVRWVAQKVTSGFCSPLIDKDRVYFVNDAGVAHANDLETGDLKWEARIAGPCWASPVAAAGRLYFFAKSGYTTVLDLGTPGGKPALIANNKLEIGDNIVYGVAFVDGRILVRTGAELICLTEGDAPSSP